MKIDDVGAFALCFLCTYPCFACSGIAKLQGGEVTTTLAFFFFSSIVIASTLYLFAFSAEANVYVLSCMCEGMALILGLLGLFLLMHHVCLIDHVSVHPREFFRLGTRMLINSTETRYMLNISSRYTDSLGQESEPKDQQDPMTRGHEGRYLPLIFLR